MSTLKQVFDTLFTSVKFDDKLAKAIYGFHLKYINSNRDHSEFFGGNLMGVQRVRFTDKDLTRFFEMFDVDVKDVIKGISLVPDINPKFKISSDTLNLTTMYLIHRFLNSEDLMDDKRLRAAYDVALIFFYRTIAALLSHHFIYLADKRIVQAAYSNLSSKYLIKRLGTWHKVMDYRATDLTNVEGIHFDSLKTFDSDIAIVYAINDSQGRIKDLVKGYYGEIVAAKEIGESVGISSQISLDLDGTETLKERVKSVENVSRYLLDKVGDKHSFIKDEYITVIVNINSNTSFKTVSNVLNWICDNNNSHKYHKLVDEFITKVTVYSNFLIHNELRDINKRDYGTLLVRIKNLYLSTRSRETDLHDIRDLGEKIVNFAQEDGISNSMMLATRTSIILYITLLALINLNS